MEYNTQYLNSLFKKNYLQRNNYKCNKIYLFDDHPFSIPMHSYPKYT